MSTSPRLTKYKDRDTTKSTTGLKHSCTTCGQGFKSKYGLIAHARVHRREGVGEDGSYSCTNCQEKFTSSQSLKDHKGRHLDDLNYCPICHKHLSKGTLALHLHSHYIKDLSPTAVGCHICSKQFESPLLLASHMNVHKGDYSCPISLCRKSFSSLQGLKKHKLVHNSNDVNKEPEEVTLVDCDYCSEIFDISAPTTLTTDFNKHLAFHKEEAYKKKFLCDGCGLNFRTKRNLQRHSKLNHKNSNDANEHFGCPICDKTFTTQKRLQLHKVQHHIKNPDGDRKFKCPQEDCGSSFNQKVSMNRHITISHLGSMMYKCPIEDCLNPGFSYAKGLRSHLSKEHRESYLSKKKYLCEVCYKNFMEEEELQEHLGKVHAQLKCKICKKQFKMLNHLKEHTLRHAAVRPYKCPFASSGCTSKGYIRQKQLTDHIQKCHPDEPDPIGVTESITYIINLP